MQMTHFAIIDLTALLQLINQYLLSALINQLSAFPILLMVISRSLFMLIRDHQF